jgi:hypothetical protein
MWLALSLLLTAHPATGDKGCGACHREQQVQLDASAHGHVFTSPLFQLSWKSNGTRGWCLTCHARAGMTCESCHDPKTFGPVGEATCARCHQFKAPEARFAAVAMQNTLEEWKRAGTSTTCAGCHFDHTHRSAGERLRDRHREGRRPRRSHRRPLPPPRVERLRKRNL